MNIDRPWLVIILLAAALAVGAQEEILTNTTITEMTRAGLSEAIILRKIKTASCLFDLTAAELIVLKRNGVKDGVIEAMIDRQKLIPPNSQSDNTPPFSESGSTPNSLAAPSAPARTARELVISARTIAFVKSSANPSRQALEKELMKRNDFRLMGLTITRYKDSADLFVEIGYVPLSWLTHRYVYRVYDRRSGMVITAGETTSWGSLAENLARHIAKGLAALRSG